MGAWKGIPYPKRSNETFLIVSFCGHIYMYDLKHKYTQSNPGLSRASPSRIFHWSFYSATKLVLDRPARPERTPSGRPRTWKTSSRGVGNMHPSLRDCFEIGSSSPNDPRISIKQLFSLCATVAFGRMWSKAKSYLVRPCILMEIWVRPGPLALLHRTNSKVELMGLFAHQLAGGEALLQSWSS